MIGLISLFFIRMIFMGVFVKRVDYWKMSRIIKVPYYFLAGSKWKESSGSQGCVPLNTLKCISFDRSAPNEPSPPRQVPVRELNKQVREKSREKSPPPALTSRPETTPPQDAEQIENPPTFDLLDVPGAMKNMGWPVSAELATEWFGSAKHIYDDNPNSVQPIDSATISLDWCLNFGGVKDKYNDLISRKIYNEAAGALIKNKIRPILERGFQQSIALDFNTKIFLKDLRKFHMDWQFQIVSVSSYDTLTSHLGMTDLTAALANFGIYAAIGHVEVRGDRYYKYDRSAKTRTYCMDAQIKVTHVYVYVKDNYSFNDSDGNSQYLGHWNKKGVILTKGSLVSELVNGRRLHTRFGNSIEAEMNFNWKYLFDRPLDKPVDKRTGVIRKFMERDVYWPVYNSTYNRWRERHNRGGDFMIYSKPKYVKLGRPIEVDVGVICRPAEKM
ncbi:DUF6402 family protein [Paraburkholderia bryophila]|uniref:DUF6402 family protein n=1 Tax=Paraburkholderia bryophila TaxID=420952 RepID=UPI001FC89FE6|nr:DUF6402 family protein [Paraburkholderia bryophila]